MQIPLSMASQEQLRIRRKLKLLLPNGCQKILLVEPPNVPEEDFNPDIAANNRYPMYEPYGLGVISSCIALRGYAADIIDLNFMLQDCFKKDQENFEYKIWKELLKQKIDEFHPDIVGLTCMFTVSHRSMVRIARFVKEYNPKIIIVAGGVHTTMATGSESMPGRLVLEDCKEVDFICLNEGNDSFGDFLDIANDKIGADSLTQVATLINGDYTAITKRAEPKAETLNIAPNYHDLPIERYSSIGIIGNFYWLFPPGTLAGTVLFIRGCRAHCRFCSVADFNGKGVVLKRSKEAVYDQFKRLRDRGITHVMFLDDDLFNGQKETVEFFGGLAKLNLGMTWDASNGVIASALTPEIAHVSAESGCIALAFGIESGNPEVLKNIPKPSGVKHYLRAGEIMKKHPKIFTKGYLIVGFPPEPERNFPGESIKMIWDTINLAKQMDLDWYTIQPLNLIPGVDITNHALVQGIITEQELIDGSERPLLGATGEQIKRAKKEKTKARPFVNYLDGDPDRIPLRVEMADIWFVMDYMVNYEKLWQLKDPIKINMLHKLFTNMCDITYKDNALGNLFFALLEHGLGNIEQANFRLELARQFSQNDDYWRKRFSILGLSTLIKDLELRIQTM
ncbi:MAG: radical SAM protein [Candidatus Taylorbacteria bacterium]|nr:radical SAM protein [Candidatus Taylorbacteria bacterium]